MKGTIRYFVDSSPVVRVVEGAKVTAKIYADGRGIMSWYDEDGNRIGCLIVRQAEDIDLTDQLLAD